MKRGHKKGDRLTTGKYMLNLDKNLTDMLSEVLEKISMSKYPTKSDLFRDALRIGFTKLLEGKE